jgi:hypothetical protein
MTPEALLSNQQSAIFNPQSGTLFPVPGDILPLRMLPANLQ